MRMGGFVQVKEAAGPTSCAGKMADWSRDWASLTKSVGRGERCQSITQHCPVSEDRLTPWCQP